jgi:hypothetical protein
MRDHRRSPELITDVLDALDRHGYPRGGDEHVGRAVVLISDLARIYEGFQHRAYGPSITLVPSSAPSAPPGPDPGHEPSIPEDDLDAVTLTHAEVTTVLTSLDLAADWKRDRVETYTYCRQPLLLRLRTPPQRGPQLRPAGVQLLHHEQSARDARSQPRLAGPPLQPRPAAEREAGQ